MKAVLASTSRVVKAATNSESLRATVPKEIVEALKLKVGDLIIWSVDEERKDGKKVATVQKFIP
jgi:bifunctional DNA-binding transcriptional regulator/antitoxin component of YhaV-PrlF toxin-antitoxin module